MRVHEMLLYLLGIAPIGALILVPMLRVTAGTIEYKDLVAIQLTAVTLVVAVLGIGIAALAFIGYRELVNLGTESAKTAAVMSVSEHFSSNGFKDEIRKTVIAIQEEQTKQAVTPPSPAAIEAPHESASFPSPPTDHA